MSEQSMRPTTDEIAIADMVLQDRSVYAPAAVLARAVKRWAEKAPQPASRADDGKPTVIKSFPGQAVEEYRRTHGGTLPGEETLWLENLITAIKASGWPKITEIELDDLHALALKGLAAVSERGCNDALLIVEKAIKDRIEDYATGRRGSGAQLTQELAAIAALEGVVGLIAVRLSERPEGSR